MLGYSLCGRMGCGDLFDRAFPELCRMRELAEESVSFIRSFLVVSFFWLVENLTCVKCSYQSLLCCVLFAVGLPSQHGPR